MTRSQNLRIFNAFYENLQLERKKKFPIPTKHHNEFFFILGRLSFSKFTLISINDNEKFYSLIWTFFKSFNWNMKRKKHCPTHSLLSHRKLTNYVPFQGELKNKIVVPIWAFQPTPLKQCPFPNSGTAM